MSTPNRWPTSNRSPSRRFANSLIRRRKGEAIAWELPRKSRARHHCWRGRASSFDSPTLSIAEHRLLPLPRARGRGIGGSRPTSHQRRHTFDGGHGGAEVFVAEDQQVVEHL